MVGQLIRFLTLCSGEGESRRLALYIQYKDRLILKRGLYIKVRIETNYINKLLLYHHKHSAIITQHFYRFIYMSSLSGNRLLHMNRSVVGFVSSRSDQMIQKYGVSGREKYKAQ